MRQRIRLLLVTLAGVLAAGGIEAAAAQAAAPVATTGTATAISRTGATLTGTITPNGNAVLYEFEYGTTSSYNKATTAVILGPSSQNEVVSAKVTGLTPGTTYHFRLSVLAESITSTGYYYLTGSNGLDQTFRTVAAPRGALVLRSHKLRVRRGAALAPIRCASVFRCRGRLTLTKRIRVGRHHKTIRLGSKTFSIRADRNATVRIGLSRQARTILRFSRHHRTNATLTAKSWTHQRGFRRGVSI